VSRAARDPQAASAADLAARLASDSWEVRSAARDALAALGQGAVEQVRPLVGDPRPEVRAAAARTLLDLGDDEWLQRELLG
jgi:HEAT repeat protein